MAKNQVQTETIKVKFNGKEWTFDYSPDLEENHFKKVLAAEVPEIVNSTAKISYEEDGKVKVITFEKKIGYKG